MLWIIAALASLASVFSLYVTNTAIAMRVSDEELRAEAMISAALELTAYRLIGIDEAARPTSGAFSFQLGGSAASVEFRSEGARIDLNAAPKAFLAGLFASLGATDDEADTYAERVIGWRTWVSSTVVNNEAEVYRRAGAKYLPRQGPFQNVSELRLVLGLPPEIVQRALPLVTIFNGRAEIDPNEAAPEALAALPQIDPNSIPEILKRRDPKNPKAVLPLLGLARASVATESRKAVRARIQIALDRGRKTKAEAVILLLEQGPEPYRVLAWRDDFDGLLEP